MRRKFDNLILDYRKLGLDNENLLKKIDRINNEKKIIIERENEVNDLLKKIMEDRDKVQKLADQNKNTIKEKIKYINNINKKVDDKNEEKQKGDIAELNYNLVNSKKEIEEKKQKQFRNKEKGYVALKAQIEANDKK